MKILVLGAAGYLGSRICQNLSKKGYQVIACVRSKNTINEKWLNLMYKIIVGDIRRPDTIQAVLDSNVDIMINLISLNDKLSESDPTTVSSINVMPAWHLLFRLSKTKLKKFIYFSTIHVYGKNKNMPLYETENVNPGNMYGLTHLLTENICNFFNNRTGIDCINIRLSNSYGPPIIDNINCWNLVLNDFCRSAYFENRINIKSDGKALRDFIHGDDVVTALEKIILFSENLENTYNLCSGSSNSILDLAFLVKNVFFIKYNKNIKIYCLNKLITNKSNSMRNKSIYSNQRIRDLGFKERIPLNDGISGVFDFFDQK